MMMMKIQGRPKVDQIYISFRTQTSVKAFGCQSTRMRMPYFVYMYVVCMYVVCMYVFVFYIRKLLLKLKYKKNACLLK